MRTAANVAAAAGWVCLLSGAVWWWLHRAEDEPAVTYDQPDTDRRRAEQ